MPGLHADAVHPLATSQPTADDDSHATNPPIAHPPRPPTVDPPAVDPPPSAAGHQPIQSAKMKLPKISLPQSNGRPVKWIPFWDSYESAILSNHDLSSVGKFNYLRSLIDDVAFDAIAGVTLSSSNDQQAIDYLHKRFGSKLVLFPTTWKFL